jgi:hypothetical protein
MPYTIAILSLNSDLLHVSMQDILTIYDISLNENLYSKYSTQLTQQPQLVRCSPLVWILSWQHHLYLESSGFTELSIVWECYQIFTSLVPQMLSIGGIECVIYHALVNEKIGE